MRHIIDRSLGLIYDLRNAMTQNIEVFFNYNSY